MKILILGLLTTFVFSHQNVSALDSNTIDSDYKDRGLHFQSLSGDYSLRLQSRIQFRYANPFDADPRTQEDLERRQSSFMIRRGRLKLSGNAGQPWVKYYIQYDWAQPVLRDSYLELSKYSFARIRLGRGKVIWNDERVTSSGNQQFVNRSILNDVFTVDRQQGIQLLGQIFPDTWHDLSYSFGIFSGSGVSERNNDDNNMMYTARLQWNVLGGEIDFSQSDFEKTSSQQFNIAVAGASNRTRCTAFETDAVSCRQLAGFDSNPNAGRYRVEQLMAEARYQWAGLSVQSESHWKDITDNEAISNSRTRLWGVYAQTGYFINGMISSVPDDIEVAYRYAIVDPNLDVENDRQTESTLVVNWFEEGHSSKVSLEVAQLRMGLNNRVDNLATQQDDGTRIRAQWDISF